MADSHAERSRDSLAGHILIGATREPDPGLDRGKRFIARLIGSITVFVVYRYTKKQKLNLTLYTVKIATLSLMNFGLRIAVSG